MVWVGFITEAFPKRTVGTPSGLICIVMILKFKKESIDRLYSFLKQETPAHARGTKIKKVQALLDLNPGVAAISRI